MSETDRLPGAWKPSVGDKLAGFLVSLHERESQYGSTLVTVLVVDSGDTEVSVWCSPRQLREFAEDTNLQPGKWLEIRYEGESPTRGGHWMKRYSASLGPLGD